MGPAYQPDLVVFERDHARKIKPMRIHITDKHGVLLNKPKVWTKIRHLVRCKTSTTSGYLVLSCVCRDYATQAIACAKSSTHLEMSHV